MHGFALYGVFVLLFGIYMPIFGQSDAVSFPKRQKVALIGSSMLGWVNPGDSLELFIDETFESPIKRGDFVVIAKGGNPKIPLLKKVVGVEGDSVRFWGPDSSYLRINGEIVTGYNGSPLALPIRRKKLVFMMVNRISGKIPASFFWVTGSSPGTHDSSLFGPVHRRQILGTAKRLNATEAAED
jgi:signal peptidase I